MLMKELNQILFSGIKDSPWIERLDGWVAMFCIFLVGVSAFWLHECLERDFQRRLQSELAHLEAVHRSDHENILNELLALINEASENGDAGAVEDPEDPEVPEVGNYNLGFRNRNPAN